MTARRRWRPHAALLIPVILLAGTFVPALSGALPATAAPRAAHGTAANKPGYKGKDGNTGYVTYFDGNLADIAITS